MTSTHSSDINIEAGGKKFGGIEVDMRNDSVVDAENLRARSIQKSFGPLQVLRNSELWLDRKLGIETQGIDRIPEEEKRPPSIINSFLLWWSLDLNVGVLPIGILGPTFGLSLNQSAAGIVVGMFLGALCTAYTGTLGPKVSHHKPFSDCTHRISYVALSSVYARSLAPATPSASGALSSAPS